jgi:precorrin-3B synthase
VLSAAQLLVLSTAAVDLGDGHLELTSRANIQIRALQPGAPVELSERLYAAGLLPSITHERVRNILASPLSGLDHHSLYDVLPAAGALDRLLCSRPGLAALPGRFLFALDDGRNDLAAAKPDVAIHMVDSTQAELVLGGSLTGALVPATELATVMVNAAEAFLLERAAQQSEAWRLAELVDGPQRVLGRLGLTAGATQVRPQPEGAGVGVAGLSPTRAASGVRLEAGRVMQADGGVALVVTVPLGVLRAEQAETLAEVARAEQAADAEVAGAEQAADAEVAGAGHQDAGRQGWIRVTPGRSVVVPGVRDVEGAIRRLQAVGLVLEASSAWNGVTSCAGRPGCGKALADVRGEARRVVGRVGSGRAVHWSGCERRCGRPGTEFVDVLAVRGGYSVDGVVGEVEVLINEARAL